MSLMVSSLSPHYYYHYSNLLKGFSHQRKLMDFPWSLSDSKSPQVFRTFLNILTDLSNAVVEMVSTYPLISKSSSSLMNPLGIVPSAQVTTVFTVIFSFLIFISSPARSRYLSFFLLSLIFILWFAGTVNLSGL